MKNIILFILGLTVLFSGNCNYDKENRTVDNLRSFPHIVFVSVDKNSAIHIINVNGQERHKLTNPANNENDHHPRPSPDGKKIAFIRDTNKLDKKFLANMFKEQSSDVYTISADGKTQQRLTSGYNIVDYSWKPDGKKIIFTSADSSNRSKIYSIDAQGGTPEELFGTKTIDTEQESLSSLSPDGKKIACILFGPSENDKYGNIYITDADGNNSRQLTNYNNTLRDPLWSPDGKKIAFLSGVSALHGFFKINIIDVDTGRIVKIEDNERYATQTDWSPNGEMIVYTAYSLGLKSLISVVDIGTMKIQRLSEGTQPRWIPQH